MLIYTVLEAHFTLFGSREQAKWPAVNQRFWPISGGATLRPDNSDCLQLPPAKPVPVPSGPFTIQWEIGNGAHHVGQCTAYLIDTKTGASETIGSEKDCVSLTQSLKVDLSKHSCTSCVIKATVAAAHLGPSAIENYDSCLDVVFSSSASDSNNGAQGTSGDSKSTESTDTAAPAPSVPGVQGTTLDGSSADTTAPSVVPVTAPAVAPPVTGSIDTTYPPTLTSSPPTVAPASVVVDPLTPPDTSEPLNTLPGFPSAAQSTEAAGTHLKRRRKRRFGWRRNN